MSNFASLNDNVIDSRDIIKRVEELESDLGSEYESLEALFESMEADYEHLVDNEEGPHPTFAEYCQIQADEEGETNYLIGGEVPDYDKWLAGVSKDSRHTWQDAADELETLQAIVRQGEGCGDWAYGESLISEEHFTKYAEELADDIGAVPRDAAWPLTCIDWEAAADLLKQDYSTIDVDGSTYYIRD